MSEADTHAIERAALDYIEGWYQGDEERMARCLHPDLAKRAVSIDPDSGRSVLRHTGAGQMVEHTKSGRGKTALEEVWRPVVEILDVFGSIASVKVTSRSFVDYLHVARFDGAWLIVNVLWAGSGEVADFTGRRP
jgi:hypothetical protein